MSSTFNILISEAFSRQLPCETQFQGFNSIIAHPLKNYCLLSIVPENNNVNIETVLKKIGEMPGIYGIWLPAIAANGSLILIRRVMFLENNSTAYITDDEVAIAKELVS